MSDKLLNTFHLRRKLNADIETLGETSSEAALVEKVRSIVQKYDLDLILTVLRKYLDTSSSQLRGGLGRLAALLPYEETTAALRHEAANRQNPTQARLTAALILERFLSAEVPPALMSDLKDPEVVVMQSLKEALEESKQNGYVLLDYVRQMRQEGEDVAYMVLDLLNKLPAEERPHLLRLIAYDTRGSIARRALDDLAALRQPPAAKQAAEALHTLRFNLPPESAEWAERNLRKLRFSGIAYEPPELEGWRALLTPCGLGGDQDLWFLRAREPFGVLIGLRLNVSRGVVEAFGSEEVDLRYLPPGRAIGEMISISMESGNPSVFLEVPAGYALWCLRRVVNKHWQQPSPRPLPEEYTLYNVHLCRHTSPKLDPKLDELFASGPARWEADRHQIVEITTELLGHPAMGNWFFPEKTMREAVERITGGDIPLQLSAIFEPMMAEIFAGQQEEVVVERLQSALLAQAGWLAIAGHERNAGHAILLAESLAHIPIKQHPLIELLVEVGLASLVNQRTRP